MIKVKKYKVENVPVYDIEVEDNHNFYADGVLVKNCEVLQPVLPIQDINDENGMIGLCTLSAVNLLETQLEEIPEVCEIIVRVLDEILDYQKYPIKAVENFVKRYRSLGVGITNLAGLIAARGHEYSSTPEVLELIDRYMEHISYYLIDTSVKLAKKKGKCEWFNKTWYSDGVLPYDRANQAAKNLTERSLELDWETLRDSVKKYGMRHSTLLCTSPTETSSLTQNSTNGMDPVREIITKKFEKQVVPNPKTSTYTLAFDVDNKTINEITATIQKWTDMGISMNHYYDKDNFEGGQVPMSVLLQDWIYAYKLGIKTMYYCYTKGEDSSKEESGCVGGACQI